LGEVGTLSQRFVKRVPAQDRGKLVSVLDGTVFRAKPDDRGYLRRVEARQLEQLLRVG
jgi:hypothetical protein